MSKTYFLTAVFDVTAAAPVPDGNYVVLADTLVTDAVAEASARRCAEAVRRGSRCIVAAARRSTRDAFLAALEDALPGRDHVFRPPAEVDPRDNPQLLDAGAG